MGRRPGGASVALLSRGLAGSAVLTEPPQQAPGWPRAPISPRVTLFGLQRCPPEVGVTTLSFHPWDMSAGTLVSELVPDDRSEVLPQTPGRGSLPAAGGPSPEDCSEATPGGGGAGRMEEGHRAASAAGTTLHPQPLPGVGGPHRSLLSVASSRASSVPQRLG